MGFLNKKYMKSFKEVVQNRRSFYALSDKSLISDKEIQDIVEFAVLHVPSSFNSQTTRAVLLLGDHHRRLWEITKDTLKGILPESAYPATEGKIDKSFAAGYGTVLFYEDKAGVRALQEQFPLYSDNFPVWSQQSSAMHQFTIWAMLEEAGFGVSLQHYGNLIVEKVAKEWRISPDWELIAQMPFGLPVEQPGEKQYQPIEERVFVFK
jgi:predicted oxidoreductase (fatty acid repression mutant protein)